MINDIDIFKKLQENCSNIFLLDEDLCLGNSYQIINNNIITLSAALNSLGPTIDYFNQTYTYFSQNSAKYIEVNNNLTKKQNNLDSMVTCISTVSSYFDKPFNIFYDTIIEVNDWNTNVTSYKNKIKEWLMNKYTPNSFILGQKVTVGITLYIDKNFNLANNRNSFRPDSTNINAGFYKELNVKCVPPIKPPVTVNCTEGTFGSPNYTCRICTRKASLWKHSRWKSYNAYTKCKGNIVNPVNTIQPVCGSTGAKMLKVSDDLITSDRHTTTLINLYYFNSNGVWTLIS